MGWTSKTMAKRDQNYGVHHTMKAENRANVGSRGPGIHPNADSWWKESEI